MTEPIEVELEVQEHGLYNFCKRISECLKDGYEFDFESNDKVPTTYGTLFVAILTKKVKQDTKFKKGKAQVEVISPLVLPETIVETKVDE